MANGRDSRDRWLRGVSGAPRELQLQPGHPWRYPRGTSGNPGGWSRRRKEFERLQREALEDPELLKLAMQRLKEAIEHNESWAVQWYLNKVWPDDGKNMIPPARLEVVYVQKPFAEGMLLEAAAPF
jgi:hypothetical protein